MCIYSRCTRRELEHFFATRLPPHAWLTTALRWLDWEVLPNPPAEIRTVARQTQPHHTQSDRRREEGA